MRACINSDTQRERESDLLLNVSESTLMMAGSGFHPQEAFLLELLSARHCACFLGEHIICIMNTCWVRKPGFLSSCFVHYTHTLPFWDKQKPAEAEERLISRIMHQSALITTSKPFSRRVSERRTPATITHPPQKTAPRARERKVLRMRKMAGGQKSP